MDTGVSDTWIYPGISGDRTGETGILEKSGIYAGSDHTFVLSFVEGWICPDRNGCCDGGRIYECSKWIPVSVFQKENGFLSQSSNETVRTFAEKA